VRSVIVVPILALACTGGAGGGQAGAASVPTVKATSYPVWYAAKRIGAPRMKPEIVLPAGEDAATWQPSGDVVASLGEADLILINGAGFEGWVRTATLPTAKVVDSAKGVDLVEIEGPTHSHGKAGEHSHTGVDPHIWADPERFLQQARNVHDALVKADPAGQMVYDGQLGAVERNATDLVAELDPVLAQLKERSVVANHPTFTYWGKRGGFDIPVVDMDPAVMIPEETLAKLRETYPAGTLILWESRPKVLDMDFEQDPLPGFVHVVLDPLEGPAADGQYDYFAQSRLNVANLKQALARPIPEADTDAPTEATPAEATPDGASGEAAGGE